MTRNRLRSQSGSNSLRRPGLLPHFIRVANLLPLTGTIVTPELMNQPIYGEQLRAFEQRWEQEPLVDEAELSEYDRAKPPPLLAADLVTRSSPIYGENPEDHYAFAFAIRSALEVVLEALKSGAQQQIVMPSSPNKPTVLFFNDGRIERRYHDPYRDIFLPELERSDLNLSRVRRCEACSKFFWADRRNKRSCSESCASTLRSRLYRSRRIQYEKNRRINRRTRAIRARQSQAPMGAGRHE